jgi:hypothetical protein
VRKEGGNLEEKIRLKE